MKAAYEHNGQPVSAAAFYAIACDPRRSVAVEACAGAGKTWMLVSRIVRALLEGAQPQEILAITFTKRAAGEMRERLHDWLEQFAHADDATLMRELAMRGFAYEKGPQPSPDGAEQLSNLYQKILETGRAVQIRTFHSWFAALLRSAPLALLQQQGLPLNYELLEDDAPARALVWRRFYAALVDQPELKADFEAVVRTYGRFQADKALQAALDKRTEFALADATGVVDSSVQHFTVQFTEFGGLDEPEELLTSNRFHRQTLRDAAVALARASAPTFAAKGVELEQAISAGDMQAAFTALLTEKGTPRKFGEKIIGIEQVRVAQELVLRVLSARQQHDAWLYQQRMARLARLLIAEFSALKQERGWVDMNDIETAALSLLGDELLSGWVQQRLDARIRHLLIDEFQDTNPLQWQALWSWL
ncbi:MAG: UvrD-helicase domain-containing protein, partial [Pseudomonadota bacterium]